MLVRGLGPAPQQYRIGVVQVAAALRSHLHLAMRHSFALVDLLTATLAIAVLFRLLVRSELYGAAGTAARWAACGAFTALVAFYLPWSLWYIRPETWTTTASIALLLWCLTRETGQRGAWVRVAATLAIALVQAVVRADVVILMELGVFLVCLLRPATSLALRRWVQAATSLAAALLAGGVQLYLSHVVYPQASYGSTPVWQWRLNLLEPGRWLPFVVVMVPYAWFVRRGTQKVEGAPLSSVEIASRAMLPGSLMYLGVFLVLGKMDEVRIFMPFLLALTPAMALLLLRQASAGDAVERPVAYS